MHDAVTRGALVCFAADPDPTLDEHRPRCQESAHHQEALVAVVLGLPLLLVAVDPDLLVAAGQLVLVELAQGAVPVDTEAAGLPSVVAAGGWAEAVASADLADMSYFDRSTQRIINLNCEFSSRLLTSVVVSRESTRAM